MLNLLSRTDKIFPKLVLKFATTNGKTREKILKEQKIAFQFYENLQGGQEMI